MAQLLRGPLAAVALASMLACPAKDLEVSLAPPSATLDALAVLPVEVAYPADAAESVRRTHDLLSYLWHETGWRVLDPRQFRLLDENNPELLTATDLVIRAQELGFDARSVAVLRARVSMRVAHGAAEVSGGDQVAVGRHYQGHVDAALELLATSGKRIATIRVTERVDPFAERADYDDLPAARLALQRGLAVLRDGCPACFAAGLRPAFEVYRNPAALLDARGEDGSSLRQELETLDGPEREARLWTVMQYLRPELTLAEAKRFAKVPPAACVGSPAPPGLESGDCIIAVEGRAISGPHALAWALAGDTEVALTIIDTVGTSRIVLLTP